MNDFKDIAKLLKPLIKGSPVILFLVIVGVLTARKAVNYMTPKYESVAKIKLDDSNGGLSNTILYKDFELFPTGNKIATEIEVLKSEELLQKVAQALDFDVAYFRVGQVKTSEMYQQTPFRVDFKIKGDQLFGRSYHVDILSDSTYLLTYVEDGVETKVPVDFGTEVETKYGLFTLNFQNDYNKGNAYLDTFFFEIKSESQVISEIRKGLDIMSLDKDVPVIRIAYKHPIPEKTLLVANALANTYIEDYIISKAFTAQKTLNFIDEQIGAVNSKLKKSESEIERYKLNNKVINLKQQTETGLKKLAELEVQLANLEMSEKSLDELNDYVTNNEDNLINLAPQVGFGDLLYTELMKKIKSFETEKEALLKKYQPEHKKIQILDKNIGDLENYVVKSIQNAKTEISTKRQSIAEAVIAEEEKLTGIPAKEKDLLVLERNFVNNQQTYNFLVNKRTEAAIAAQSNISFHRILQEAKMPKKPISPNKTLLTFIAGFLGIVLGVVLVYSWHFLRNKITDRTDIEKNSGLPVLGVISKSKASTKEILPSIWSLANQMVLKRQIGEHQMLSITSTNKKEGKTYIASQLGMAFAEMGYKVLLVDGNTYAPNLHKVFSKSNEYGITDYLKGVAPLNELIQTTHHSDLHLVSAGNPSGSITATWANRNVPQQLEYLKKQYEIVIFDTPSIGSNLDGLFLLKCCDHNLFVVKSNSTKKSDLVSADVLLKEYGITGLHFVLNQASKRVNYEGFAQSNKSVYKKRKLEKKQGLVIGKNTEVAQ